MFLTALVGLRVATEVADIVPGRGWSGIQLAA